MQPNIYVSWSTSELRVRLASRETGLSPPVIILLSVPRRYHLCYLFLVFVMFSRPFIAA